MLNFEVPDVAADDLGSAVAGLHDDFHAYAIGFAVMGLFWYGHHRLFARLKRTNGPLLLANMLLLALIALMPFTSAVLDRYDEPLAVALFAGNVGLAMILDGVTQFIAIDAGLFEEPAGADWQGARATIVGMVVRSLVFFASIPLAYAVSPDLAKWSWLLLIPLVAGGRWRASHSAPASVSSRS